MSVPVDEDTVVLPGLPSYRQGGVWRATKRGYESDYVTTTINVGTHLDALPSPLEEGDYLLVHTGWGDEHIHGGEFYLESLYYAPEISEFVVEDGPGGPP